MSSAWKKHRKVTGRRNTLRGGHATAQGGKILVGGKHTWKFRRWERGPTQSPPTRAGGDCSPTGSILPQGEPSASMMMTADIMPAKICAPSLILMSHHEFCLATSFEARISCCPRPAEPSMTSPGLLLAERGQTREYSLDAIQPRVLDRVDSSCCSDVPEDVA